jgi:phage terminase small subunit
MSAKVSIRQRVAEIQQRGAERAEVTVESLMTELDEAIALARAVKNPSAFVAAVKEKGVLSGQRVERREVGEPGEFDALPDDEIESKVFESAKELGVTGSETQH